jgi:hypothetical protein
LWRWRSWCLF